MTILTRTRIGYINYDLVHNRLAKNCGCEPDDDFYFRAPVSKEVTLSWPKHGINKSEIVAMCPDGYKPRPAIFKPEDGEDEAINRSIGGHQSVREEAAFLIDRALGYYLVPVSYVAEVESDAPISKAVKPQEPRTDAMVAFELPQAIAKRIVAAAGKLPVGSEITPLNEFHVTLLYLGEVADLNIGRKEAADILRAFAQGRKPIAGRVCGVARFGGKEDGDTQPIVLLFDSPELPQFRQELVDSFGVFVPEQEHGYTSHITLAYVPRESTVSVSELSQVNIPVTFDELLLAWCDEHSYYPLGEGLNKELEKSNKQRGAVIHYVPVTKRKLVSYYLPYWVERAAIFDFIMGQIDRRNHNWMSSPVVARKPVLYDNGFSLPADKNHHIHSAFVDAWRGKPLSDLDNLERVLRDTVLWSDARKLIGTSAVELAQDRVGALMERGKIPDEKEGG